MKIKRFLVTSGDSKRVLTIAAQKIDTVKKINDLIDFINGEKAKSTEPHSIKKLLLDSFGDHVIEKVEHLKHIVKFKFAYSITNGHHNDIFNLETETKIIKGRLESSKNDNIFEMEEKFFSYELLYPIMNNYAAHITSEIINNFRKTSIDEKDVQITEITLEELMPKSEK